MTPEVTWFSDYQIEVVKETNSKSTSEKLVPRLMKCEDYVLHYRSLKFTRMLYVITSERIIALKQSK